MNFAGRMGVACVWVILAASTAGGADKRQSVAATSDVEQIRAVLTLYAKSLDRRDFPALKRVFTADATGNYFAAGTYKGVDAISAFIERVLTQCGRTQHLLGSIDIQVNGNEATASTYLQAIHVGKKPGFEGKIMTVWGEYRDKLLRTADGWRISYRELETIHAEGDIGVQF
jgi:ketosteroid isomerase-like protein